MRCLVTAAASTTLAVFSTAASARCPAGELQLAFDKLPVRTAFIIIADYAGLKANIDPSVTQSAAIHFACTPWRAAAEGLASTHQLSVKIENGVLHVRQ